MLYILAGQLLVRKSTRAREKVMNSEYYRARQARRRRDARRRIFKALMWPVTVWPESLGKDSLTLGAHYERALIGVFLCGIMFLCCTLGGAIAIWNGTPAVGGIPASYAIWSMGVFCYIAGAICAKEALNYH